MQTSYDFGAITQNRQLWNKGKLIGQKPPIQPKHVWAIRTRLQLAGRKRDLALFDLAIDSKLRGCDLISLKVERIALHGYAIERVTVRQRKTGRPVRFELSEQTRQAVDDYLSAQSKVPNDYLFKGRLKDRPLTRRQYARLVADWISSIGLDPLRFGTHSLRRRVTISLRGGSWTSYRWFPSVLQVLWPLSIATVSRPWPLRFRSAGTLAPRAAPERALAILRWC